MPSTLHLRLPYRIKRLYLLTYQRLDEALRQHGLARTQWQVLVHVARAGELSQRELQRVLLVEPATLTGVVDALAAKGWIDRLPDPTDRRVRLLRLTAEGEQRLASAGDPMAGVEDVLLEGVGVEERAVFERVLERMAANLEGGTASPHRSKD